MSFKVDDNEWRDAVRRHFLHIWGESLNNIPEDREGTFHGHDGTQYPFHGKAELLEAMPDPRNAQHAMIDRGWKNFVIPGICLIFGGLIALGSIQRLIGRAQFTS